MNIKTIEPTPSPNTMKIILDEELPMGTAHNYKLETHQTAPTIIQELFQIPGIKGIYHVADFLAIERNAKYDWKDILSNVRGVFGEESQATTDMLKIDEHFGEVKVFVQIYKDIPMQIKLQDGNTEKRYDLPAYFKEAIKNSQFTEDNIVLYRKWVDKGVRYGSLDEIGQEMQEELMAAYPKNRLDELVHLAILNSKDPSALPKRQEKKALTKEALQDEDWKVRYSALEQMVDPTSNEIELLATCLKDERPAIRRLATVYLGMIKDEAVLPYLYEALNDSSVTVRRTAGDCISDLGFPSAQAQMAKSLSDRSKLVRWRAAMFLYEEGTTESINELEVAVNDPEFEVALQARLALERIKHGKEAMGSVWKQMTLSRQ